MPLPRNASSMFLRNSAVIFNEKEKPYRLTPIILTFYEGILTHIDIQKMIEMDIHIVRFKMSHVTRADKLKLIELLDTALTWVCEKFDVSQWPVAISMDIPNACIRSGYIDEHIPEPTITLRKNSIIEMTSDVRYWNKCTSTRIFMDDPHTMETIKVGTQIAILSGIPVVTICVEVVDTKTILCEVITSGRVDNCEFVCIRGLRLKRPALGKKDMALLEFSKEFGFDVVTVNGIRRPETITSIRKIFGKNYRPIILSSIADQEGVDKFDDILKVSDGIIMLREYLAYSLIDKNVLVTLQMQFSGKCKQACKPFFVSGNVMETTLMTGELACSDLSDLTNAVMQGAGFVLKNYTSPANAIQAMEMINALCKSVESAPLEDHFYRICDEFKMPVNAADACLLGCAMMARQTGTMVIIIPTVSGKTAIQLSQICPNINIIAISTSAKVAKKLQVYRGVVAIIYDKKHRNDYYKETESRIQFAVLYGIKKKLLKYGDTYVTFAKSLPTSAYCDQASVWTVVTKELGLECDEEGVPTTTRRPSGPVSHVLGMYYHKQRSLKHREHQRPSRTKKDELPEDKKTAPNEAQEQEEGDEVPTEEGDGEGKNESKVHISSQKSNVSTD